MGFPGSGSGLGSVVDGPVVGGAGVVVGVGVVVGTVLAVVVGGATRVGSNGWKGAAIGRGPRCRVANRLIAVMMLVVAPGFGRHVNSCQCPGVDGTKRQRRQPVDCRTVTERLKVCSMAHEEHPC